MILDFIQNLKSSGKIPLNTPVSTKLKKSCSLKFCDSHRKTLVLESLFNKVGDIQACIQVFSCEYYEIFRNTYFEVHMRKAASELITQ